MAILCNVYVWKMMFKKNMKIWGCLFSDKPNFRSECQSLVKPTPKFLQAWKASVVVCCGDCVFLWPKKHGGKTWDDDPHR